MTDAACDGRDPSFSEGQLEENDSTRSNRLATMISRYVDTVEFSILPYTSNT